MTGRAEPTLLRIRVLPRAKQEGVQAGKKGVLHVSVKEPAAENRANARAISLVAAYLKIPSKAVRIIRGHHLRVKLLEIYANKP